MAKDESLDKRKIFAAGLPIGLAVGIGTGIATHNMGVGIAIGVALALVFGQSIINKRKNNSDRNNPSEQDK